LTKLNTVVDRSEFNMDASWAETGDRYMLKLFRDFLFHQVGKLLMRHYYFYSSEKGKA
jgi:PAB-dependent poly(A)-specific ribonuclease subunit 3